MLFAKSSHRSRRAFTLVELLTVIVIIGILAGLVTAAAIRVQSSVKKAAHALELKQLDMALQAYKERFGDFPPDDLRQTNATAVSRHFRRAFPRYSLPSDSTDAWTQIENDVLSSWGVDISVMDYSQTLTFFLGGMRDSGAFTGFSANPADPFATGGSRIGPFYTEFDYDRLSSDGKYYYPTEEACQTGDSDKAIRYYRANMRVVGGEYDHSVVAFKDSNTSGYINPRTFQILSPGLRGGSFVTPTSDNPCFPAGPYDSNSTKAAAQLDMMSNFTTGTMEDAMP